mmetsp:Transcript_25700/g.56315  ORF Transcript_25700/g.56315 Transcript_25700/m.56315 type:complete len:152 (-) Transcript_25700:1072-1527(-)
MAPTERGGGSGAAGGEGCGGGADLLADVIAGFVFGLACLDAGFDEGLACLTGAALMLNVSRVESRHVGLYFAFRLAPFSLLHARLCVDSRYPDRAPGDRGGDAVRSGGVNGGGDSSLVQQSGARLERAEISARLPDVQLTRPRDLLLRILE